MNRTNFFAMLILFLHFSCKDDLLFIGNQHEESLNTLIEVCWNQKDLSIIDSVFAENVTRTVNNVKIASNRAELTATMQIYFTGFPDLNLLKNNSLNKNNQIIYEWIISGTNTGVFGEVKATGKKIKISGFTKIIFNDKGKIIHENVHYNELELLQQLGYGLIRPNVE